MERSLLILPDALIHSCGDSVLKQCRVPLGDLQSKNYAHCQIICMLCRVSLVVPPSDLNIDVHSVISQEESA